MSGPPGSTMNISLNAAIRQQLLPRNAWRLDYEENQCSSSQKMGPELQRERARVRVATKLILRSYRALAALAQSELSQIK